MELAKYHMMVVGGWVSNQKTYLKKKKLMVAKHDTNFVKVLIRLIWILRMSKALSKKKLFDIYPDPLNSQPIQANVMGIA